MVKKKYREILLRGQEQAKILFEENNDSCYFVTQPIRLLLYYVCEDIGKPYLYELAYDLFEKIYDAKCVFGNRYALVASLIYIASLYFEQPHLRFRQEQLCSKVGISDRTFRSYFKELFKVYRLLEDDFWNKFLEKIDQHRNKWAPLIKGWIDYSHIYFKPIKTAKGLVRCDMCTYEESIKGKYTGWGWEGYCDVANKQLASKYARRRCEKFILKDKS